MDSGIYKSRSKCLKYLVSFIFTDDQVYDTLGIYGNPDVKTPNIDSLGIKWKHL